MLNEVFDDFVPGGLGGLGVNEIIHWLLKAVSDLGLTVTKNRESIETPEVFTHQDANGPCTVASQQNPAFARQHLLRGCTQDSQVPRD